LSDREVCRKVVARRVCGFVPRLSGLCRNGCMGGLGVFMLGGGGVIGSLCCIGPICELGARRSEKIGEIISTACYVVNWRYFFLCKGRWCVSYVLCVGAGRVGAESDCTQNEGNW